MGEALRSLVMLVWAVSAVSTDAHAQSNMVTISDVNTENEPTIIYGKSENAQGQEDEAIVVQPKSAGNPLGNPIVRDSTVVSGVENAKMAPSANAVKGQNGQIVDELSPQNPAVSAQTPEQVNSEIQNTLYESGGRIYDEQSYPINDINTIMEPNLDKEITNYPSY